jgi:hypothetical protein
MDYIPVDEDHWVCFQFTQMQAKRELPHNEVDSLIDMKSSKFIIKSSLPQFALLEQYALTSVGDYHDDDEEEGSDAGDGTGSSDDANYYELDEPKVAAAVDDGFSTKPAQQSSLLSLATSWSPFSRRVSAAPEDSAGSSDETEDGEPTGAVRMPEEVGASPPKPARRSKAFTGTQWTFPAFAVRMKLGAKMNLEWVRAERMQIEFLNARHDILQSKPDSDAVERHPFFLSTKMSALWCGPAVTCDLGVVNLKASVAGILKATPLPRAPPCVLTAFSSTYPWMYPLRTTTSACSMS